MRLYFKNILIALDQLANSLLAGCPDETLSSRCWRLSLTGKHMPRIIVDMLFWWDKDHCKESYESERLRKQLPPELR